MVAFKQRPWQMNQHCSTRVKYSSCSSNSRGSVCMCCIGLMMVIYWMYRWCSGLGTLHRSLWPLYCPGAMGLNILSAYSKTNVVQGFFLLVSLFKVIFLKAACKHPRRCLPSWSDWRLLYSPGPFCWFAVACGACLCVQCESPLLLSSDHYTTRFQCPHPSLSFFPSSFSPSFLFKLSISSLINNSLLSPWCLVTLPSYLPPCLPPLTSPALAAA